MRKRKVVELDHEKDAAIKRLRAPRALEACFAPAELSTLKRAFHRIDSDGSGSVSVAELSHLLVKRFDDAAFPAAAATAVARASTSTSTSTSNNNNNNGNAASSSSSSSLSPVSSPMLEVHPNKMASRSVAMVADLDLNHDGEVDFEEFLLAVRESRKSGALRAAFVDAVLTARELREMNLATDGAVLRGLGAADLFGLERQYSGSGTAGSISFPSSSSSLRLSDPPTKPVPLLVHFLALLLDLLLVPAVAAAALLAALAATGALLLVPRRYSAAGLGARRAPFCFSDFAAFAAISPPC